MQKRHVIWVWVDEDGTPRFISHGPAGKIHPAQKIWDKRNSVRSELSDWLCTLDAEPQQAVTAFTGKEFSEKDAKSVVYAMRVKARSHGHKLFSNRDKRSYVRPINTSKAVLAPNGDVFQSVREAARVNGLNQGSVTRACQRQSGGWQYI